ncbi:MAG: M23 family metallopeptidase [Pseudomonadota bacterium]
MTCQRLALSTFAVMAHVIAGGAVGAAAADYGPPANCTLGEDCFIQQLPDMDPGSGDTDPFCGTRTYDTHRGTDLRVASMADAINTPTAVIAIEGGTVLRVRDGMADHLVENEADSEAVEGRECGNGLVIDHGDGTSAQYCHLARGSLAVAPGDTVAKGDPLGNIGASGQAAFPHVHLTVRNGDTIIDPTTGRALEAGCLAQDTQAGSLWNATMQEAVAVDGAVIGLGVSGTLPNHDRLVRDGGPPDAAVGDGVTVGWAWFINLEGGDVVRITLQSPTGAVFADNTLEPIESAKAAYSAYAGRRRPPEAGLWRVIASVTRNGEEVIRQDKTVLVE